MARGGCVSSGRELKKDKIIPAPAREMRRPDYLSPRQNDVEQVRRIREPAPVAPNKSDVFILPPIIKRKKKEKDRKKKESKGPVVSSREDEIDK